jgi:hypothetical protein
MIQVKEFADKPDKRYYITTDNDTIQCDSNIIGCLWHQWVLHSSPKMIKQCGHTIYKVEKNFLTL